MREIITLKGETDGVSTSGDFLLFGDLILGYVNRVVIPFGLKAKIWAKRMSGDNETLFSIYYTKNTIEPSPTWILIDAEKLASKGEISLEKRRPIVLRSLVGVEGFKISWSQPTAAKAYIELEVEFTDEES